MKCYKKHEKGCSLTLETIKHKEVFLQVNLGPRLIYSGVMLIHGLALFVPKVIIHT